MQRLAEVLLEPRKQYTRLEKLVSPCTHCNLSISSSHGVVIAASLFLMESS